jgi:hypothetical protein
MLVALFFFVYIHVRNPERWPDARNPFRPTERYVWGKRFSDVGGNAQNRDQKVSSGDDNDELQKNKKQQQQKKAQNNARFSCRWNQ